MESLFNRNGYFITLLVKFHYRFTNFCYNELWNDDVGDIITFITFLLVIDTDIIDLQFHMPDKNVTKYVIYAMIKFD